MESPESPRDRDRDGEDEDWEFSERRRHRSGRSRRRSNPEDSEEWQSGARRKSGSERGSGKKKSTSSGKAGSGDEDDYDDKGVLGPRSTREDREADDYVNRGIADKRDKMDRKSSSGYQDAMAVGGRKGKEESAGAKASSRLEEDDRSRRQGGSYSFSDHDRNQSRKGTGRAAKAEAIVKVSSYETSQSKSKGKGDFYRENDPESAQERGLTRQGSDDARYAERKGSAKEKGEGGRGSKHEKEDYEGKSRRWDETDCLRSTPNPHNEDIDADKGERRIARGRDKLGTVRDRENEARNETGEFSSKSKSRFGEAFHDNSKPTRASGREERRIEEAERRTKGRGKSELHVDNGDGFKANNMSRDDRSDDIKDDKQRRMRDSMLEEFDSWEKPGGQRQTYKVLEEKSERHKNARDYAYGGWDEGESWDVQDIDDEHIERGRLKERREMAWDDIDDGGKSAGRGIEDGGRSGGRGRNGRGVRHMKRSWSPDRKRARRDSEEFDKEYSDDRGDSDTERSISLKGKERERDGYREDRLREKDSDWMDRSRDWDGSKDHWKTRHHDRHDKDKADEGDYEFDRDWELHGRDRDRMERDKIQRGAADRKDRGRMDGMKNIPSFGIGNDVLDRRNSALDYGRVDSGSPFVSSRRHEAGGTPDFEGDWGFPPEERGRMGDVYATGADSRERYDDDAPPGLDQNFGINSGRIMGDGTNPNLHGGRGRGHKGSLNNRGRGGGQMGNGGQSPFGNNQGSGSFTRMMQQGGKGGRGGRGGRGRVSGRDTQRGGIPLPMMGPGPGPGVQGMGPPFGPLGLPPGALQSMGPGMGPGPGPPMGPGGFIPPYPGHVVWGGRGGGEMNMLAVPPGLTPVPPPGPSGPRFVPNMAPGPNQGVYFNQPGPGRGPAPGMTGTGYAPTNPMGRGMVNEKPVVGRGPPRITGPAGKAPSRGEQNDYSQNFVDTGMRPQNFIRELELTNVVEDYPKLRELIQKKDEIVAKSASAPLYLKCDLRETILSPELFGTKFDVILVDPPWEEYVHRAPGVGDHMEYWTFEEIQNLKIEAIADNPSFIFLWVGDGLGLEQGRLCLKKWGFRRCEDICWVKTNKANPSPGLRHDSHTLFQHSKEHCLMGIKGTVRRSTDGHIIHANIDTDIIIAEEPPHGSTTKPEDLYRIIEHFALGRRRLELFGEDHNIRAGWLTVGKGLSSSNFNIESYMKNFVDKDGKLWQGGAGRNPPPDAPHLVGTSPEIESLRPKSPPQKNQQQQQANSVSQPAANSTNKKTSASSPGPPQNSQASTTATPVTGSAQEIQASNTSTTLPALPVSEIARSGGSAPVIEQRPIPMLPSTSRTSGIGSRVGLEVEGGMEDEKFLDAGTPSTMDLQK